MAKQAKFKEGDVLSGEWETRVIFLVTDNTYFYLTYNSYGRDGFFYNPTNSAVSWTAIESKYEKVGEVKNLEVLEKAVTEVQLKFSEAFIFAQEMLKQIEVDVKEPK